ncbi:hypothetical protein [Desulfobacter postgatei]|uniref:hypothetical protein n=1 Tax=Desulfobacter postgatei TaxID=2293 RepID=UPI00259B9D91|nr:hypothetical protein [uncultured Desulfobacter sp.]
MKRSIFLILGVLIALSLICSITHAQTYTTAHVAPTATDPVTVFTFTTPSGQAADGQIVVGRFVTNITDITDESTGLSFTLRSHGAHTFTDPTFNYADGNVDVFQENIDGSAGPPVGQLRLREKTDVSLPSGYKMVQVSFKYYQPVEAGDPPKYTFSGGDAAKAWEIRINKHGTDETYLWGFYHEGTDQTTVENAVKKPKLIEVGVTPEDYARDMTLGTDFPSAFPVDFTETHIGLAEAYVPDLPYTFQNVGTDILDIQSVNPTTMPSGPFDVNPYFVTEDVQPMTTYSRVVKYRPTALGDDSDSITLSTNTGNLIVNLAGKGVRLSTTMSIDLSGSMTCNREGTSCSGVPDNQQKIYFARAAAQHFVKFYYGISPEAHLALYSYPDHTGKCPSTEEYINLRSLNPTGMTPWNNHLDEPTGHADLLTVAGGDPLTPLAEAISTAYATLSPLKSNADGPYNTTAAFIFGDGQHSCNSTSSRPEPEDWYNWSTFQNSGIRFFTVPYGQTYSTWQTTFENLADRTDGESFPADITNELALQQSFLDALAKIEGLETLKDPTVVITANQTKEHEICATESTQQLIFSVHWTEYSPQTMEVSVITPTGTTIGPGTVSNDVSYISGLNYAGYVILGDYLQGKNGVGKWRLKVKANSSATYMYQVYARDWIQGEAVVDNSVYPPVFTLAFPEKVFKPDTVQVSVNYSKPASSYQTLLAKAEIDPKVLMETPEKIEGKTLTWAERKAYVFEKKSGESARKRKTGTIQLEKVAVNSDALKRAAKALRKTPTDHVLLYQATMPAAAVHDGVYENVFIVNGITASGECFQREYRRPKHFDVYLEAAVLPGQVVIHKDLPTVFNQQMLFVSDELKGILDAKVPEGMVQEVVQIEPKDTNGNFFGIGKADQVAFELRGAEKVGGTLDMLDGSYYQVIQYKKNPSQPISARVKIGNVESVDKVLVQVPLPPPPPVKIWWIIAIIIAVIVIFIIRKLKTA